MGQSTSSTSDHGQYAISKRNASNRNPTPSANGHWGHTRNSIGIICASRLIPPYATLPHKHRQTSGRAHFGPWRSNIMSKHGLWGSVNWVRQDSNLDLTSPKSGSVPGKGPQDPIDVSNPTPGSSVRLRLEPRGRDEADGTVLGRSGEHHAPRLVFCRERLELPSVGPTTLVAQWRKTKPA